MEGLDGLGRVSCVVGRRRGDWKVRRLGRGGMVERARAGGVGLVLEGEIRELRDWVGLVVLFLGILARWAVKNCLLELESTGLNVWLEWRTKGLVKNV